MKFYLLILFVLGCAAPLRADPVALLQSYLKIDTTNPPGNEGLAARFWKEFFDKYGIENELIPVPYGKDRINIVARVPGNGKKRPIILENHLDVVPADRSQWSVDPFQGVIKDGKVYGRGVFDMKSTAVIQALALVAAKTKKWPLDRDLIFVGSVNEEGPLDLEKGVRSGVDWLLENRLDVFRNAEYVLNEGTYITLEKGKRTHWDVSLSEKMRLELLLKAKSNGQEDTFETRHIKWNALHETLQRIFTEFHPAITLSPSSIRYFKGLSQITPPGDYQKALQDPKGALKNKKLLATLRKKTATRTLIQNTFALTMLAGGGKGNTVSGIARAFLLIKNETALNLVQKFFAKKKEFTFTLVDKSGIYEIKTLAEPFHASDPFERMEAPRRLLETIDTLKKSPPLAKLWGTAILLVDLTTNENLKNSPNFLKDEISATFDLRLLPTSDAKEIFKKFREWTAAFSDLEWFIIDPAIPAGESSPETPLFQSIERARDHFEQKSQPKPPILTPILGSTSDSCYFRAKGMTVYGFDPFPVDPGEDRCHGNDELIPVETLKFGTKALQYILQDFLIGEVKEERFL